MMVDKRIVEALDVCRPASDDWQFPELADVAKQVADDPELAQLQRRLEEADLIIAEAIDDVPVPSGLAQRLLERLAAESNGESVAATLGSKIEQPATDAAPIDDFAPASDSSSHHPVEPTRPVSRRRFVTAAVALAASIAVATTAVIWQRSAPELTPETVQEFAQQQYEGLLGESDWQPMTAAPHHIYPKSTRVASKAWGWQPLDTSVDRNAIAYDLTPRGSDYKATLMVVRTTVPGLTNIPQKEPVWTQDRLISAWQQGDLLYVLVLEAPPGSSRNLPHRYRQLVDTGPGIVG